MLLGVLGASFLAAAATVLLHYLANTIVPQRDNNKCWRGTDYAKLFALTAAAVLLVLSVTYSDTTRPRTTGAPLQQQEPDF